MAAAPPPDGGQAMPLRPCQTIGPLSPRGGTPFIQAIQRKERRGPKRETIKTGGLNLRMKRICTKCDVQNHVDRKKSVEVLKLIVDDKAEFTRIDAETLKKIGVKREKKDYTFVMANGQQITRPVGFAVIRIGDALTIDEVIFGEPGDLQILGARSLEGMNLRVGSRAKKLMAGGPILAA